VHNDDRIHPLFLDFCPAATDADLGAVVRRRVEIVRHTVVLLGRPDERVALADGMAASRIEMRITAVDAHQLDELLQQLTTWGCHPVSERDALVRPAEKDHCVPDDFYSTTNHRTQVRVGGRWTEVEKQRMDAGHRCAQGPPRLPEAA